MKKLLGLVALVGITNYSCIGPKQLFDGAEPIEKSVDSSVVSSPRYKVIVPQVNTPTSNYSLAYHLHFKEPVKPVDMKRLKNYQK